MQSRKVLLQRWHSLSGVVPLSAFVVLHLAVQSSAFWGAAAHERVSVWTGGVLWTCLEAVLLYVPLAFHSGYGVWAIFRSRSGATAEQENSADHEMLLRLSGAVVLVFLVFHWAQFRYPLLTGDLKRHELYTELCASLSSTTPLGVPLLALVYLLGLAATMMHLSYGLNSFLRSFEILDDPERLRKLKVAQRCSVVACSTVFAAGAALVVELATGSWFLGLW